MQPSIHPQARYCQAEFRAAPRASRMGSTVICLVRDATGLAGLALWAWASLRLLGAL